MQITKNDKKEIEKILEMFDFVKWDRFIDIDDCLRIYGWIDRDKDSYKDFIVLEFNLVEKKIALLSTSSTEQKVHDVFNEIIGGRKAPISKCHRVEWTFDIVNSIKLK